jgi:predicted ATPase
VTGSPGIGKSRLAQSVAVAEINETQDGVWWVDLAPIAESEHVAITVAIVLGLSLQGASDPLNVIVNAVRDQAMLIVLDNAEHVVQGVVALCTALRQEARDVRLLITSQEPLKVEGESVFRTEALALPSSDDPIQISESAAVMLFVCRARAVERRFELRPDNHIVIAEICRALDGIPLAIELAAARVPLLGVDGLREKLDQRLHVLTAGRRETPRRHQTLRAALDWSHHLLSAQEQAVFRRLGVFMGGFTLEAAQEIASDDAGIDQWDVLEHLGALVEKSLVVAEGDSHPRYRMLETTRLFALERLIENAEAQSVRRRHRDYFLRLAEERHRDLLVGDASHRLVTLDRERDNLLLALAWAPEREDAILGLRLAAALHHYWFMRAMPALGAQVTKVALGRPGAELESRDRCRALVTAGWLASWAGQEDEAVRHLDEALRIARDLADPSILCFALVKLAHVRDHRNELDEALRLSSEALASGRGLGDGIELSDALVMRAIVHMRFREHESARSLLKEALALRHRLNLPTGIVSVHSILAVLAINENSADQAKRHLDAAIALMPIADHLSNGLFLISLGAQWAAIEGRPEAAVFLEAASYKQHNRAGLRSKLAPREAERIACARLALDDPTCEKLEIAGRAMDYGQALHAVGEVLNGARPFA